MFRSQLKPHLENVASHARFTPEIARRLGNVGFTGTLKVSHARLMDFVERQEELLQEIIRGLDKHSRAALALIFMRNDALESPVRLRESERFALGRLGTNLGETIEALGALQESLTVNVKEQSQSLWRFKHPTVGDAFGSIVLKNPELMDIYIEGASADKLLTTITCGNVGLEGAVVVPQGLFESVSEKLTSFLSPRSSLRRDDLGTRRSKVETFLAKRCDSVFLKLYLSQHPEVLKRVCSPGLYLYAVTEVDLALRLFEFGLLAEEYRRKFVGAVIQYAIDGDDDYVLRNSRLRNMVTPDENAELIHRLKSDLVPNLSKVRHNWEINHYSDEDPESYMEPLKTLLHSLESEFGQDAKVVEQVNKEREAVNKWISDTREYMDESRDRKESEGPEEDDYYSRPPSRETERDIFDDVDL
jgi:hypothetical protein